MFHQDAHASEKPSASHRSRSARPFNGKRGVRRTAKGSAIDGGRVALTTPVLALRASAFQSDPRVSAVNPQAGNGRVLRRSSVIVATIAIAVSMSAGPAQGQGRDPDSRGAAITDLGTLGGGFSAPLDLNDRGQVVGVSVGPGETALRGFVWNDGAIGDIGSLGGPQAAAASINAAGQIGGWSDLDVPAPPSIFNTTELFCNPPMVQGQAPVVCHAVLRDHGRLVDLGTLGGLNSAAQNKGINDQGQVVGVAETTKVDPTGTAGSHRFHAFLWQRDGQHGGGHMIDLGTLGNDPNSSASGINDRGQIIGVSVANSATFTGDNVKGFTWNHGRTTPLKTLGGTYAVPAAINNRGDIVGLSDLAGDLNRHATLWKNGRTVDLGTLPGDGFSAATDITDSGLIVGISCGPIGCRAVRWDKRQIADLASALAPSEQWQLLDAQAANAHGQVVGSGQHADLPHGYIVTPR
jgi:probable HAF family extracellular repeat protein